MVIIKAVANAQFLFGCFYFIYWLWLTFYDLLIQMSVQINKGKGRNGDSDIFSS